MADTEAVGLLRSRTADLVRRVGQCDGPPSPPAPPSPSESADGLVVVPCPPIRGGLTEQLLAALVAHHQALDAFDRALVALRGRAVPAGPIGSAVGEALDGVYQASDAAHETVRRALSAVDQAARLQDDAVRLAHLAVAVVVGP